MYVVFHTVKSLKHEHYQDYYEVFDDIEAARQSYEELVDLPDTYCAGIAPITEGTEPHWIEESP